MTLDGSLIAIPAKVTLAWPRSPRLTWVVDEDAMSPGTWSEWHRVFNASKSFMVDFGGCQAEIDASLGTTQGGFLNGGVIGSVSAELDQVVVHWIGLPRLWDAGRLHIHSGEAWQTWSGRTEVSLHGWELRLDARFDLDDVLREARELDACVITHVMELRRTGGETFEPGVVGHLLAGLQRIMSFATGHWVSPAVPVGFAKSGEPLWSEWRPGFAEPTENGHGWWDQTRPQDLWEAVDKYLGHWLDPDRIRSLQFATIYAISAAETGFLEQRLLTAVTGLELLSWDIDIRERKLNEESWRGKSAYKRLNKLLTEARIPTRIEPKWSPALSAYALSQGFADDGPKTITEIRHQLTHPKNNADLYAVDKALAEAQLLALRYLELVLLHRIGYHGNAYDRTRRGTWPGDSPAVPWAQAKPNKPRRTRSGPSDGAPA